MRSANLRQQLLAQAHPEWHPLLSAALTQVDSAYLSHLLEQSWLPGIGALFAAFSLPLAHTQYLLLGESPYPRAKSANGYAFWDAAVGSLWSSTGLSKEVNRATSLRNFIKMLLHARGDLQTDFSQQAIAKLNCDRYCQTATDLFRAMIKQGFLLLNASLVYEYNAVPYHAKQWRPFMTYLLNDLAATKPHLQLLLFGKIANQVPEAKFFSTIQAEHPYNLTFITNPNVLNIFRPMDLLYAHND